MGPLTIAHRLKHAATVQPPETRYTRIGDDRIAYQVLGEGPDLAYFAGPFSHVDVQWEGQELAPFLRRLASFARLICFDRRGMGASESVSTAQRQTAWEEWVDDLESVLDAVGSEHSTVFATATGGPAAVLFAASRPDRTSALVLGNSTARWHQADDYPQGIPTDMAAAIVSLLQEVMGTEQAAALASQSLADDPSFRRWYAKFTRAGGRFREAAAHMQATMDMDVRHVLPSVQLPTLVLHRTNLDSIPFGQGQYLADMIPGAKLVELPGTDVALWAEHMEIAADAVEEFITGTRRRRASDRILATVLFTDIVDSTHRAAAMGDRRWASLLTEHHQLVGALIEEFRGRLIKTTGDGALATFDGPTRAIQCAAMIRERLKGLGIEVRCGLHAGEVELLGDDVGGIGVHIASRILAEAGPSEIVVSGTVRDLAVGSETDFADRGERDLKGVPGSWRLFEAMM